MVYADIFPETRSLNMRAVMKIKNKSDQRIDSLHLSGADGQKYILRFDNQTIVPSKFDLMPRPALTIFYGKPDTGGYRIFALPRPLMPGDTATLEFRYTVKNPGFVNDGYGR